MGFNPFNFKSNFALVMAITKFNFKLIGKIEGPAYVRQLKEAIAVINTWGWEYLKDTNPALFHLYRAAKKFPTTQKEWTDLNTKYFTAEEVLGNDEIPVQQQDYFLTTQTYLEENGLAPLNGLFKMPQIRQTDVIGWWAWDGGLNGRWFKRGNELAKTCDNLEGFYHSAISTYASRIERNLPLYES